MTMSFREAVDLRIASLHGRPVDAAQLREAMQVIQDGARPRLSKPVHAAAAIVDAGRVTLAPILVVDFYGGAAWAE